MKCLVVGYGSIGARHASILKGMGHEVCLVTGREIGEYPCFRSVGEAIREIDFGYVVVANRTCDHFSTLSELVQLGYRGLLLIEKPLFDRVEVLPDFDFRRAYVAYNLRFHPVIQELASLLRGRRLVSIQAYVGQYLPFWRPGTDYRRCYSAYKGAGGGALRDLSHELDYILRLTGGWRRVSALGGKYSDLEIDSDDLFCLLLETENCPVVFVQMNYLDRRSRREIIVNCSDVTIKADLVGNRIEFDSKAMECEGGGIQTYVDQHRSVLKGGDQTLCSIPEGMEVLRLIENAEDAVRRRGWKER